MHLLSVTSVRRALKYELVRLGNLRSVRGAAFCTLIGSAILTLPAARHMVGLAHPSPPAPAVPRPNLALLSLVSTGGVRAGGGSPFSGSAVSGSAWTNAVLHQYSPMHGGGAWVVAGGVVGMVLPGAMAACVAAWLGATSIGYEYRHGGGTLTFTLLPKRVSVLAAKAAVAACLGALLCLGATVAAYWTAWLGFRIGGEQVALPLHLMLSGPRAVAIAALGGVLGVSGGAVLRVRLLATVAALAGCALVAVYLPRSTSLAVPYVALAAQRAVRFAPAVTCTTMLSLLLALPLASLVLSGLIAVRRRRVA